MLRMAFSTSAWHILQSFEHLHGAMSARSLQPQHAAEGWTMPAACHTLIEKSSQNLHVGYEPRVLKIMGNAVRRFMGGTSIGKAIGVNFVCMLSSLFLVDAEKGDEWTASSRLFDADLLQLSLTDGNRELERDVEKN